MSATKHLSVDTPLSEILGELEKSGERIILTNADGRPVADVVPHDRLGSGAGLLDSFVSENIPASLSDMGDSIAQGAIRGFEQ